MRPAAAGCSRRAMPCGARPVLVRRGSHRAARLRGGGGSGKRHPWRTERGEPPPAPALGRVPRGNRALPLGGGSPAAAMPHLVVCSCDPKRLSHFFVPPPLVGGGCGSKIIKNRNPEIQPTSPLAMERCTRGAKAVEEVFLERMAILFSPLRRGGFLQNPDLLGFRTLRGRRGTLAWTRTTRSGARGLLVDSMACAVAVRISYLGKKNLFSTPD